QRRGRCPAGANTVKPTFPIMEALLWRRAVAGPVRPRGTPMTSRHGHPVGARLRQFYAALIDERRLGARRSFFARVFSFSESLPRSATGAFRTSRPSNRTIMVVAERAGSNLQCVPLSRARTGLTRGTR